MVIEYGTVGVMRIDRESLSTRGKTASVSLCPPQIPSDVAWDRICAAAIGIR